MLTESQQNGIREFLLRLDEELILSIANTTTKKALVLTSIEEAVNAILLHSESVSWFLNRKKITRTLLFEYLSWKRVPISGQAEKHIIIEKVIELWDCVGLPNGNLTPKTESSILPSLPAVNHDHLECSKPIEKPEMGLQFAQWFYGILLSIYNQSPLQGRLLDQFWNDGSIKITVNTPGNVEQQNAVGSEEAANLLHALIVNQNLLNPNLTTEGIREKKSPHGFTIIGVCGTVHHQGNCSGIFEQVFGLLQDPASEFRWRIKWTELRMTQATVNRLPCVNDLPELLAICDSPHVA